MINFKWHKTSKEKSKKWLALLKYYTHLDITHQAYRQLFKLKLWNNYKAFIFTSDEKS